MSDRPFWCCLIEARKMACAIFGRVLFRRDARRPSTPRQTLRIVGSPADSEMLPRQDGDRAVDVMGGWQNWPLPCSLPFGSLSTQRGSLHAQGCPDSWSFWILPAKARWRISLAASELRICGGEQAVSGDQSNYVLAIQERRETFCGRQ